MSKNRGMKFQRNTVIHFDDRESEWFHPGDDVPDYVDVDSMNPDIFVSAEKQNPEYFDNYEEMYARDLIKLANERGIYLSTTRKTDVIATLRAHDTGEEVLVPDLAGAVDADDIE